MTNKDTELKPLIEDVLGDARVELKTLLQNPTPITNETHPLRVAIAANEFINAISGEKTALGQYLYRSKRELRIINGSLREWFFPINLLLPPRSPQKMFHLTRNFQGNAGTIEVDSPIGLDGLSFVAGYNLDAEPVFIKVTQEQLEREYDRGDKGQVNLLGSTKYEDIIKDILNSL